MENDTDSAHVSILQEGYIDCGVIEIASFNVLNTPQGGTRIYSEPILLAAGDYKVVVSALGQATKILDLSVGAGEIISEDFVF